MELPLKDKQGMSLKKLHPSWIVLKLLKSIKGFIFFCLFISLFLGFSSTSIFSIYGAIILSGFVLIQTATVILEWKHFNYYINGKELFIEKGKLITMKRYFPLENIQGITQNTSFFHRLMGLTSLLIDIGSSEKDSSIKLEMISLKEAASIKEKLSQFKNTNDNIILEEAPKVISTHKNHYEVAFKEILIASFTSLSMLFFIVLLYSMYSELNQFFSIEIYIDRVFDYFNSSNTTMFTGVMLLIILSMGYGLLKTYIQYGGFKVTSDVNRIYIEKGRGNKTYFSVPKEKVQALCISSGFIHKILDIVNVKLISSIDTDDQDMKASNVLFPFIKRSKANSLIPKVLPSFKMAENIKNVPRISILVKLVRTFYLWLLLPTAIYYFFPSLWYMSLLIFISVFTSQIFNGLFSGYALHNSFLQFKKGSIVTKTFIMKRTKIERIMLSETIIQRKLGLASIKVTIRSMPTKEIVIHDVPTEIARRCQSWFIEENTLFNYHNTQNKKTSEI